MKNTGYWTILAALAVLTGCQAPPESKVAAVPAPSVQPIAFEAAAKRLGEAELWHLEEQLTAIQKNGRTLLHEETLPLTILELTADSKARSQAVFFRSRCKLLSAGSEYLQRHATALKLREKLQHSQNDEEQTGRLRPLYLINHRAEMTALLQLRRLLKFAPDAELSADELAAWPEITLPGMDIALREWQVLALLNRAEPGVHAAVLPELFSEFERIPARDEFPLKRFASLPAALAAKRAASPEMDWRFAAAAGAAIGIRQEVSEAHAAWLNLAAMAVQAEAEFEQTGGDIEAFRVAETSLQRDLAALRLLSVCGTLNIETPEPETRKPTPSERLAAAWVVEYLLGREE